ncbi:MAG: hypothetical protein KKC64_16470 [Spirochaetes bacterium]|nr:hypothetical protein [Spirochaetota bacterium]
MIFNFYGAIIQHQDQPFSLSALCAMLSAFDVSAEAARVAISRMQRKGLLRSRRVGRNAYYYLSENGWQQIGRTETRSVYRPKAPQWDGRFQLVAYEIPENRRELRQQLTEKLRCAGLARVGSSLWASAWSLSEAIQQFLASAEISPFITSFSAEIQQDPRVFARRVWQLDMIEARHKSYLDKYRQATNAYLAAAHSDKPPSDIECFRNYFISLNDFIETMARQPPLPPELLPADWPAPAVQELYVAYRKLVHDGSDNFINTVHKPLELD